MCYRDSAATAVHTEPLPTSKITPLPEADLQQYSSPQTHKQLILSITLAWVELTINTEDHSMISSLTGHWTAAVISCHPVGYQSQMHTLDTGYKNPQTIQNSLRDNFLRCKDLRGVFSPQ